MSNPDDQFNPYEFKQQTILNDEQRKTSNLEKKGFYTRDSDDSDPEDDSK